MGISIPMLAIAAIFTGLPGVLAVCAARAVIAIASALERDAVRMRTWVSAAQSGCSRRRSSPWRASSWRAARTG